MQGDRGTNSGSAGDLANQFKSVEDLLGSRRADLTARLQRMRFGQDVEVELTNGQRFRGRLRGCNGVRVVMIDGTAIPISSIRNVALGSD